MAIFTYRRKDESRSLFALTRLFSTDQRRHISPANYRPLQHPQIFSAQNGHIFLTDPVNQLLAVLILIMSQLTPIPILTGRGERATRAIAVVDHSSK